METPNLAAIDIGTSSVHLAIARPVEGGRPERVLREKLPVRLGSGASDMKTLDPAAVDRALEALQSFRSLADAHDAVVEAVATSAVREAEDASDFLDRARAEADIDVAIIAGVEEARLIHLGVLGAVPLADTNHLVIDIGGGSTEFIVGHGVEPQLLRSLKVGHVRTSNRFFPDGIIDDESIAECRAFLRSFFARVAVDATNAGFDRVVGCSGTFETVAEVVRRRRDHGRSDKTGAITRAEVDAAVDLILAASTPSERAEIPGVDPHRADTMAAAALIVEALMDSLNFDEFTVSPDALREGLVLDRLNARSPANDGLLHLSSIRASSVRSVAERYGENIAHARQATDVALRLFDSTVEQHTFGQFERDILEAAAMLHNVGRFVGHGGHHRHSQYLIRNTEHLAGFHEHETNLIAIVARYHRKSAPKPSHREFAALTLRDQQLVRVLAGMLRIGIALDRTYRTAASDVSVGVTANTLVLSVKGDDLDLEVFAANQTKALLEHALGIPIVVTCSPA